MSTQDRKTTVSYDLQSDNNFGWKCIKAPQQFVQQSKSSPSKQIESELVSVLSSWVWLRSNSLTTTRSIFRLDLSEDIKPLSWSHSGIELRVLFASWPCHLNFELRFTKTSWSIPRLPMVSLVCVLDLLGKWAILLNGILGWGIFRQSCKLINRCAKKPCQSSIITRYFISAPLGPFTAF